MFVLGGMPLPKKKKRKEKLTGSLGVPHTSGKPVQTVQSRGDLDVTAEQTATASVAQWEASPGLGSCLPPVEVRGKCRKCPESVSWGSHSWRDKSNSSTS